MKTALVHDWFYSYTGAEKVVEAIYELFPSDVYTLIKNEKNLKNLKIPQSSIKTSFIQHLPKAKTHYSFYLPLFPLAIESFDFSDADLIFSSSSSVAKNILTRSDQIHICYCHTPMRYIWDCYFQYLQDHHLSSGVKGLLAKILSHHLRNWDLLHSQRVDAYIANSHHVATRIYKTYRREAHVIYPPVNTKFFQSFEKRNENFYVTASRLVPYKKIDLIIKAFECMPEKKLLVIGEGPQYSYLKKIAPKNVEFIQGASDHDLGFFLSGAKGFIFMSYEDFGMVTLEAQAAGTPVIAFGKGGSLETVIDKKTGILFDEQTPSSLIHALKDFEARESEFDPHQLRSHAQKFSKENFLSSFKTLSETLFLKYRSNAKSS